MKNIRAVIATGLLLSAAFTGFQAQADVTVRVRAGVGYGDYSVSSAISKTANSGSAPQLIDYKADYVGVPIGLTFIADDGLYFDLLHQSSSGKAKFSWAGVKPDFNRDDTTLTIGARIESVSVYMAYKSAEGTTEWPTGYSSDTFSASGFLAGMGWALPVWGGAINLSGGVGIMNGTYRYTNDVQTNALTSDVTIGYSAGAGYTYAFNDHLSVGADLRWQHYDYKFESHYSIKEDLSQAAISATYTF